MLSWFQDNPDNDLKTSAIKKEDGEKKPLKRTLSPDIKQENSDEEELTLLGNITSKKDQIKHKKKKPNPEKKKTEKEKRIELETERVSSTYS